MSECGSIKPGPYTGFGEIKYLFCTRLWGHDGDHMHEDARTMSQTHWHNTPWEALCVEHIGLLELAEEMARELVGNCGSTHQKQVDLLVEARAKWGPRRVVDVTPDPNPFPRMSLRRKP